MDDLKVKAPSVDPRAGIPQERITGDILRGHGPRRGNLEDLLKYWRPIMRKPGGFRRCLVILADHPELYPLPPLCAWLHHETTGKWPNEGNHHGGVRKRRSGRRSVRRVIRRARKSEEIGGIPIDERAFMADTSSIMSKPVGFGNQTLVEYKASRFLRGAASAFLPGERHMFRISPTRRIAFSLIAPGGRNNPLIGVGLPGRIGGSGRGFRCPPGFEHGGKFTDARFSTCGSQLFATPGAKKPIKETLRTVQGAVRTETIGSSSGRAKRRDRAGSNLVKPVKDTVKLPENAAIVPGRSRTNIAKQDSTTNKLAAALAKAPASQRGARRVIRSDGAVLVPAASVAKLASQRDNDDLKDATYLSRIDRPIEFGGPELDLLRADVRKISFVLPGGTVVEVVRNGKINRAEYEKIKKAAFARAVNKPDIPDINPARRLTQAAAATTKLKFQVKPAKSIPAPRRLITVQRGTASRTVPRWVFETFLAQSAPGRPKNVKPYKFVGVVGKSFPNDFDPFEWTSKRFKDLDVGIGKPWHFDDPSAWGPLNYTASPIPHDDSYHASMAFKAAAFTRGQTDPFEGLEVKKVVFDRAIGRFRCPPGSVNGGQLTNRQGLGCGGGAAGAIRRAIGQVASGAANVIDVTNRNERGGGPVQRVRPDTPSAPKPRRRGKLRDRAADAIDLTNKPRRRRGRVRDRLADQLDVTGQPERRRGKLRDRFADVLDLTNVPRKDRKKERGKLRERLANLIDPEAVRRDRAKKNRPGWIGFDGAVGHDRVNDHLPVALRNERDNLVRKWEDRVDGAYEHEKARRWLQANKDEMSESTYEREIDEIIDIGFLDNAIEKNTHSDQVDIVDQLEGPVFERILADMRREDADRLRLSNERRARLGREEAAANLRGEPVGDVDAYVFAIPIADADLISQPGRREEKRRIDKHVGYGERVQNKINEAEGADDIANIIDDVAKARDSYQKKADLNKKQRQDAIDRGDEAAAKRYLRLWAGNQSIAKVYDDINTQNRHRIVGLRRVEEANNAGNKRAFKDLNDMRSVTLDEQQSKRVDQVFKELVDIDDIAELDSRIKNLQAAQDAAEERVHLRDQDLAGDSLSAEQVADIIEQRAGAGQDYEAARRAIVGANERLREIKFGSGGEQGPLPDFGKPDRKDNAFGEFDELDRPLITHVEVGNVGINNSDEAKLYLERGGAIRDVPDVFLADAIKANPARFTEQHGGKGANEEHFIYVDRETKDYISVKTGMGGPHEAAAEIAANSIGAQLGMPMQPMRFVTSPNRGRGTVIYQWAGSHWNAGNQKHRGGAGIIPNWDAGDDPVTKTRLIVMDYLMGHTDRHYANVLFGTGGDGKTQVIPLDNGLGFNMSPGRESRAFKPGSTLPKLFAKNAGGNDLFLAQLASLKKGVNDGTLDRNEVVDQFLDAQRRISAAGDYLDLGGAGLIDSLPSGYAREQGGMNVSQINDFYKQHSELFLQLTRQDFIDMLS